PENRKAAGKVPNHNFQAGARSYAGHTGSPYDEPAKTLKAGVHGVPGGENMLARSDGTVRYFTVRESARLQTFPNDFVFHGSWTESMRQIGNAVPVLLAKTIGENVALHLARVS
ncbi:MAG: DNA cytosine methyltransferase, partial [Acidocella sp.]|nr:DNA cytosine methyltransferase [Acidocella sp.]